MIATSSPRHAPADPSIHQARRYRSWRHHIVLAISALAEPRTGMVQYPNDRRVRCGNNVSEIEPVVPPPYTLAADLVLSR